MLKFFDTLFPLGRTNWAFPATPRYEKDATALMDRYDVDRALVFHTVSRDADPDEGNEALAALSSPRLSPLWGYDPAFLIEESAEQFIRRALAHSVRGILLNPCMRNIYLDKSPRVLDLARVMEKINMPLFLLYWVQSPVDNIIDWYKIVEFCELFPSLPVIAWEWRSRANRPLFDALSMTNNLRVVLSSLWQAQSVDAVCSTFGVEKLLFSLGLPHLDPGSFQSAIRYGAFTNTEKEALAFGNLDDILGSINSEGVE